MLPITQAIALALGFDPDSPFVTYHGWETEYPFMEPGSSHENEWKLCSMYRRVCLAISRGELAQRPFVLPGHKDLYHVRLDDFCEWIVREGVSIPDPLKALISKDHPMQKDKCDHLPYRNHLIETLIAFTKKYYDPETEDGLKKGYNQKAVALDLDKALGEANQRKNETASRLSNGLVAMLLPSAHLKPKRRKRR